MKDISALLLDLDGTLLGITPSFFDGPMTEAMAGHFPSLGRKRFREGLLGAIGHIMACPRMNGETNEDAFLRAFREGTGVKEDEARSAFAAFYRETFPALGNHAEALPEAVRLVAAAAARGYRLALATNPVFPREAAETRLAWAGIPPGSFDLIPGLDSFRSCKPQEEYYLEVAASLALSPASCLMVGNDVEQDVAAAARVGMKTWLVPRYLVWRREAPLTAFPRGDLAELGKVLSLW